MYTVSPWQKETLARMGVVTIQFHVYHNTEAGTGKFICNASTNSNYHIIIATSSFSNATDHKAIIMPPHHQNCLHGKDIMLTNYQGILEKCIRIWSLCIHISEKLKLCYSAFHCLVCGVHLGSIKNGIYHIHFN